MNLCALQPEEVAKFFNFSFSQTWNVDNFGLVINFEADGLDFNLLEKGGFNRFWLEAIFLELGFLGGNGWLIGKEPPKEFKGILVDIQAKRELEWNSQGFLKIMKE